MRFTVPLPMMPAHHYVPMAKAAEAAGFDSIAVPDSVFFPETVSGDYPFAEDGERWWAPDTPFIDPFVAIPAMAAVTERITFLTNVLKLPLRSPLLVAKQVASIAALSRRPLPPRRRRVVDARGVRLDRHEHEDPRRPDRRSHRHHQGRVRRRRAAVGRAPRQAPRLRPPDDRAGREQPMKILVGGHSDIAMQRAARHDGWIRPTAPRPRSSSSSPG